MFKSHCFALSIICCSVMTVVPGCAAAQSPDLGDSSQEELSAEVDREILHAETYYWFGMAEQGNIAAFRKGLQHLARANSLVQDASLSATELSRYQARIEGLRIDLDAQVEIAHDTLFGVFPLTRFLTQSLFAESTTLDTFEVIDDPTVMAATFAAKKLALTTITEWKQRHQLDVVFTSVPNNSQLENEALYVFNSHPKFFVHNLREVTDALTSDQLVKFKAGNVTPEIKQRLLDAFGLNDLLVVLVRENDVVDDDYFYVLEGAIYDKIDDTPVQNFAVMGFSRDRNRWFTPIVLINTCLLAFAFFAFWAQSRIRRRAAVRARTWTFVVLPLLAFIVGRVTPWFLGPLLKSISPVPETLAIVSFWIPAFAGVALTVIPMTGFWLIARRLAKIWPVFALEARVASVFIGIAAGFAAFLSVSMFLFLQADAWSVFTPATLTAFGLAYLFGRALDSVDQLPGPIAIVPCLLALALGAAVFLSDPAWLWCVVALTTVSCIVPMVLYEWKSDAPAAIGHSIHPQSEIAQTDAVPRFDVDRLGELAERPRFQKFKRYEESWRLVEPLLRGSTIHLAIHGSRGCGLSETAKMLSSDLRAAICEQGGEAVEMHGECPQAEGEPKPYAPFQTALAQHFEIELLGSRRDNSEALDVALGDVFQSVVPFSGVLFPASSTAAPQASSGEDIAASIAWTLRRIAKRKPIVLVIDDAQWLDDASRGLLKHLISRFPNGGEVPIAIVIASHEPAVFEDLAIDKSQQFHLESPTKDEQAQILTCGIGLTAKTAREIVDRVGGSTIEQGGLFWLLQVVSSLARSGAFVSCRQGAMLVDDKWPEDAAVPSEMREVLVEQLRNHPRYRTIIQCAACACNGREFPSSLVAQALDKPRLELLVDLDRIDQETSILYDVKLRDDIFAFQSSFMLDVVKQELQIDPNHRSHEVPQIIREHHARLGSILESAADSNSQQLYQIANHFRVAGPQYADRGLKYSLRSVEAACAILDFSTADYYLQSAEDCAQMLGKPNAVEMERLYVDCLKAHVTGQLEDHRRAAEAGAALIQKTPDCSTRLLLAVAQVQYDAGKSSGEPKWFERSLEIGYRLIDEARSPQDQASGRHFVGISLPPEQVEDRRSQLRQALEIMKSGPEDRASLELLGRILGALAMELSRGSHEDQLEAKSLLEWRLTLIDEHKIGDLRGHAMTHGGLGRLAFFGEPQDLVAAKSHFEKDLELSEAINDQQGQIQMHSLLGACALKEGNAKLAFEHYKQSWQLAQNAISRFFAGAGLLECFVRQEHRVEYEETIRELLSLARAEGVPEMCAPELARSLEACPSDWEDSGTNELRQILKRESEHSSNA